MTKKMPPWKGFVGHILRCKWVFFQDKFLELAKILVWVIELNRMKNAPTLYYNENNLENEQ